MVLKKIFFLFHQCILLGKGRSPLFEQTWVLITQGCFVPNLIDIGPLVLEKKIFLNFINVFSLFCKYLPLEKEVALYLNKLHPRMLCLVEIDMVVLEKMKMWTTSMTDNRQIFIRKAHLSLRLRWAKKTKDVSIAHIGTIFRVTWSINIASADPKFDKEKEH